jgi:hypothetical protein
MTLADFYLTEADFRRDLVRALIRTESETPDGLWLSRLEQSFLRDGLQHRFSEADSQRLKALAS